MSFGISFDGLKILELWLGRYISFGFETNTDDLDMVGVLISK